MVGDVSPSVGSVLSLTLGQPSDRRRGDQRPRSDLEGIDLSGLDELVDRAATDAERLRCAVNRVCEFIHCRLRWSAAMRRAAGAFAANRRQFQRHADALGIRRSWLFPGNYPNPETTQMRGFPVIEARN